MRCTSTRSSPRAGESGCSRPSAVRVGRRDHRIEFAHGVLIEVDVSGVDPDAGLSALRMERLRLAAGKPTTWRPNGKAADQSVDVARGVRVLTRVASRWG